MLIRNYRLSKSGYRLSCLIAALAAIQCFGAVSEVRAECKIETISEFHVEMVAGSPIIDGQVNGQPIRILLETGSAISYLTITAAHQSNLAIRHYAERTLYGADGNESVETASVKELRIGHLLMQDQVVNLVGNEISDANGVASFQVGADLFSHFMTEFDFAHGVVRLLRPHDCKLEQLAYWSPEFFRVELERYSPQHPNFIVSVKVNGTAQRAKLVSGSAMSYISLDAAKDAGIAPSSPGVESAEPVGGGPKKTPVPTWIARFSTIEIGGEIINNARLHMGDVFPHGQHEHTGSRIAAQYKPPYDMNLGSDFFQAHRIVIVPDENAVLFTYNGGRVF